MITRPLDLAARLRPEPRHFDWLFYVNAGLIGLFFALFGSPFVLAPGMPLNFELPAATGAEAAAAAPTSVVSVTDSGQIFADGLRTLEQLQDWLREEARKHREPVLVVRVGRAVPISLLAQIANAAVEAGFRRVLSAAVEPEPSRPNGGR
jgi:biopolymer transport protein ExbD